jgi:hypothetical protein
MMSLQAHVAKAARIGAQFGGHQDCLEIVFLDVEERTAQPAPHPGPRV